MNKMKIFGIQGLSIISPFNIQVILSAECSITSSSVAMCSYVAVHIWNIQWVFKDIPKY